MNPKHAFLCDGLRTPFGRFRGGLAAIRTDDLAALPIRRLLERHPGLDPAAVDDVYLGCANQAGEDNRNVARMAALLAGLPPSVPGITVNRLCASGLVAAEGDSGEFAKIASEWFRESGLLPQQAKALAIRWNEFTPAQQKAYEVSEQARIQALDAKNKEEDASLRTEWGQKHDGNLELARRAARQFFPKDKVSDVVTALEDKLGYAETIKLLHSIGKGLAEHDAPGLGQQTGGGRKSIAEVLYGGTSPS